MIDHVAEYAGSDEEISVSRLDSDAEKVNLVLVRAGVFISLSKIQNLTGLDHESCVIAVRSIYQSGRLEHIPGNGSGQSRYMLKKTDVEPLLASVEPVAVLKVMPIEPIAASVVLFVAAGLEAAKKTSRRPLRAASDQHAGDSDAGVATTPPACAASAPAMRSHQPPRSVLKPMICLPFDKKVAKVFPVKQKLATKKQASRPIPVIIKTEKMTAGATASRPVDDPVSVDGMFSVLGRVIIYLNRRPGGKLFKMKTSKALSIARKILLLDQKAHVDPALPLHDHRWEWVARTGSLIEISLDRRPGSRAMGMTRKEANNFAKTIISLI